MSCVCRSKLLESKSGEADDAREDGSDLMSLFQVAHFTNVQQPLEAAPAATPEAVPEKNPQAATDGPQGTEYWEKLLGQQYKESRAAENRALGKGKRERKQVCRVETTIQAFSSRQLVHAAKC